MGRGKYTIRAVERTCDLLDMLEDSPYGVSLTDAADVLCMPKATVFRYLATLEERRYVVRTRLGGNYRPGPAFPTRPAIRAKGTQNGPDPR